ncbi:hypothetical protein [Bombiscardovia coagulans]|nr:hypothetical protein [Bombiscardovia coagulans]
MDDTAKAPQKQATKATKATIQPLFHRSSSLSEEYNHTFVQLTVYLTVLLLAACALRYALTMLWLQTTLEPLDLQERLRTSSLGFVVGDKSFADSAAFLLAAWTFILTIVLVTIFHENKSARERYISTKLDSLLVYSACVEALSMGYLSPDIVLTNDPLFGILLIICGILFLSFVMSYGRNHPYFYQKVEDLENTRNGLLREYSELEARQNKNNWLTAAVQSHPHISIFSCIITCTGVCLLIVYGLIVLLSALYVDVAVGPTMAFMVICTLIGNVLACLVRLNVDTVWHFNTDKTGDTTAPHRFHDYFIIGFWLFAFYTVSFSLACLSFSDEGARIVIALLAFTGLCEVALWHLRLSRFFLSSQKRKLKRDDVLLYQRLIESDNYTLSTEVAGSHYESERLLEEHREHLYHALIRYESVNDWSEICYPDSKVAHYIPLLSLAGPQLRKVITADKWPQRSPSPDISSMTKQYSQEIQWLLNQSSTNDDTVLLSKEDCELYLSAIFGDPGYRLACNTAAPDTDKHDEQ